MGRASHREGFTDPRRGTKASLLLELLLRQQGCTAMEAQEAGAVKAHDQMHCVMERLNNDCGYDVRTFPKSPDRPSPTGRSSAVYKCVGRMEWDGGYQDFVAPIATEEAQGASHG